MTNWKEQFEKDLTELWHLYEAAKLAGSKQIQHDIIEAVNRYNAKIEAMEVFIQSLLDEQKKDFDHALEMMVAYREDALDQQRKELLEKIRLQEIPEGTEQDSSLFPLRQPMYKKHRLGYNQAVSDLEQLKQSIFDD